MRSLYTLGLALFTCLSVAQPATDIFLADLTAAGDKIMISNAKNITARQGYDNQPYFHPDKSWLYFVSADADGRTDIFRYDLGKGTSTQVTKTHDKEYSPTVTPDKKYLSCILQKDDGAQWLVKYPINGGEAQMLINDKIVGYHAWATEQQVVVFTLPAPFQLELVNVDSHQSLVLDDSIARSIHRVPGRDVVSYMKRLSEQESEIRIYNVLSHQSMAVMKSLPGKDHDMAWTPDGRVFMSEGTELYMANPKTGSPWIKVATDGSLPAKSITRMAVSPDGKKIAFVIAE